MRSLLPLGFESSISCLMTPPGANLGEGGGGGEGGGAGRGGAEKDFSVRGGRIWPSQPTGHI